MDDRYLNEITRFFTSELEARLSQNLNFIQVLLGPRQIGKTTAIEQIMKRWPHSLIYETADTIASPDASWIELHWRRARELPSPALLVFDEIQKVTGWSEQIKALFDQDRKERSLRVVLLGSASLSIQRGLSESLAGRYEVLRAHHWDFVECKEAFGWNMTQFLQFGGYPAGAELIEDENRWQQFMRLSVLEPVLSRDIMGLAAISKPALFRQTFELCLRYPAQELALNKILGSLQDKGNITTIRYYLDLLEAAFLIKTLQKYSGSPPGRKASVPKLLPLCPALVHAVASPSRVATDPEWRGRVFELAVGAQLTRMKGELFYWREKNFEVDYVLADGKSLYAIEVKSGRPRRNQTGLQHFLQRYRKAIPVIVDANNFEKLVRAGDLSGFR